MSEREREREKENTLMVAWSVNSSSSEHWMSLIAMSLCSFVMAKASFAGGDTDILAAGTEWMKRNNNRLV